MDQAILRAAVAPAKLAWKTYLGKDLISTYGVDEKSAQTFPGAVSAILNITGELEGHILFTFTEVTAKTVEAAFSNAWDGGVSQRTLDSVRELMEPVAENIPKLLDSAGYDCAAEIGGVVNSKGKGIHAEQWPDIVLLASVPDFDNPSAKDEIIVWMNLATQRAGGDVDVSEFDDTDSENDSWESESDDGETRAPASDEEAILAELRNAFTGDGDDAPEPAPVPQSHGVPKPAAGSSDPEASPPSKGAAQVQRLPATVAPDVTAKVVTTEKLEIVDSSGKTRSILSTLKDGSPYFSMADENGRIRATLRLDASGDASLTFVDELAAETWTAPGDEAQPPVQGPARPHRARSGRPGGPAPSAAPRSRRPRMAGPGGARRRAAASGGRKPAGRRKAAAAAPNGRRVSRVRPARR